VFELALIFYLTTAPPEQGQYVDRVLSFESEATCRASMRWWMNNTDSELPGMDPAWGLLGVRGRPCEAKARQPLS